MYRWWMDGWMDGSSLNIIWTPFNSVWVPLPVWQVIYTIFSVFWVNSEMCLMMWPLLTGDWEEHGQREVMNWNKYCNQPLMLQLMFLSCSMEPLGHLNYILLLSLCHILPSTVRRPRVKTCLLGRRLLVDCHHEGTSSAKLILIFISVLFSLIQPRPRL